MKVEVAKINFRRKAVVTEQDFVKKDGVWEAIYSEGTVKALEIIKDQMTALEIIGNIHTNSPQFGYQNAFQASKGIGIKLSIPVEGEFVAIYQHKEWWIRPTFGNKFAEIPENTQLLIIKGEEEYHLLLAVSGKKNRTDFVGDENGIWLYLSSNLENQREIRDIAMVYGHGKDPYAVLDEMVRFAIQLTGKNIRHREEKRMPEIFEKIGWCTWDSLGQSVNEKAVFEKVEEFCDLGVPISWVLIDDGWSWADKEAQKLKSLEADPEKFPNGIASTVQTLKEKYKIEKVGVWQAIKGYWNGIVKNSEVDMLLNHCFTDYPNGEYTVKCEAGAVFEFWHTWHKELEKAGISFIKVDSQSSWALMTEGTHTYGEAAEAVHTGLEASADLHFNGNLINCMGMAPEDIWNRQSAALSRSSDDFTPTVPGSFAEHAFQNAYNSIYHGCFYWNDWDMVWSEHEDGRQNMLLRMISGGPFYLSDGLGKTNIKEILPVISEDGTILRCQEIGRPTLDCLTSSEVLVKKPLKIYNRVEDVIYVAAFLDQKGEKDVVGTIKLEDFPEKIQKLYSDGFWIYDYFNKKVISGMKTFTFEINPGEVLLYQLIPKTKNAILGMTDKYISRAGISKIVKIGEKQLVSAKCTGELTYITEKGDLVTIPKVHSGEWKEII